MKQISILLVLFLAAKISSAQVIDTSFKQIAACKIVPLKAKMTDTTLATHLGIKVIADDLQSSCTLYWALMDSTRHIRLDGNETLTGSAYTSYKSSGILYPFVYVKEKYFLAFRND